MFRSTYRAIVICLIVTFAVGGVVRAANAGQPCVSKVPVSVASHTEHASHQHSHHKQQPTKDSTAKCCGMCVVASTGILPIPSVIVDAVVSRADYQAHNEHWASRRTPLDPGIPKQIS